MMLRLFSLSKLKVGLESRRLGPSMLENASLWIRRLTLLLLPFPHPIYQTQ